MQHTQNQSQQGIQKLASMIKDIKIAMLTTREADGSLRSRPMAAQTFEFDGTLWFFTDVSQPKTAELEADPLVNVSFTDPKSNRYISASGNAKVVRDDAKKNELWQPYYRAWFPKGVDDPNLGLISVAVDHAEYWDSPASAAVHIIGLAKAALTGRRYSGGEHEKLEITQSAG